MMNENQDTTEQISVWAYDFDEDGNQRFHKKVMIPDRFKKKIMEEYQQLPCDNFRGTDKFAVVAGEFEVNCGKLADKGESE